MASTVQDCRCSETLTKTQVEQVAYDVFGADICLFPIFCILNLVSEAPLSWTTVMKYVDRTCCSLDLNPTQPMQLEILDNLIIYPDMI